jgi:hypothetical protein
MYFKNFERSYGKRIASALWMTSKAQADLHQEKIISEKIMLNLFHIVSTSSLWKKCR